MNRFAAVVALGFMLSILPIVAGWAQETPPTQVETEPVRSMQFRDQITLVGRTEANANSEIVSEVAGRVIRIDALEGNAIRKGDVVVSIDPRSIGYALEAKRAQVEQAKAEAELAEKNFKRAENLYQQGAISDDKFDADRTEAVRAREQYHQRVAERKQLELDLENCAIRAPFDGFTVRKRVDVGEWVNPGTPVYELVDLSEVKVVVDLPERHFGHVAPGSEVSISTSGSPTNTIRGTVTGIAPNASEVTHTFPVIVTVENPEGRLGGGMLVRTTLSLNETFTSLSVSKDAIVRQGDQEMVYTVADGKAVPIPVQTSSASGNRVAVQGRGITEGMPVVVRGNERIFPGSPVKVAENAGEVPKGQSPGQSPEAGPGGERPEGRPGAGGSS